MVSCWTSERSKRQVNYAERSMADGVGSRSPSEVEQERLLKLPSLERLVLSNSFDLFWIVVVLINTLLVGVQTQWSALHIGEESPLSLRILQYILSAGFVVELSLRIWAVGCRELFTGSQWKWACLDLLMVVASIVEVIAEALLPSLATSGGMTDNIRVVRIIRVARVMRGLRVERLIHMVSGLRTLVLSIAATLKSLMWAMLLLVIIMYIVGITLTEFVVDDMSSSVQAGRTIGAELGEYWRSLDVSMFTLFQSISGGLSWHEAVGSLESISPVLCWIFTAYISFTYFAVLNVVTGVFCNSAIESAQRTPEVVGQHLMASRKVYIDNLEKLFSQVDVDGSQDITYREFETIISNPDNRAFLSALEIEAADAWMLFKLIDTDKDGVIQKDEFIAGCLQLKGMARNVDVASLNFQVGRLERKLRRYMAKLGEVRRLLLQSVGTAGLPKSTSACGTATDDSD